MTQWVLEVSQEPSAGGYQPRGAALAVFMDRSPEVIIAGPAETGKTLACLQKLDTLCWKYPGIQTAMVRKTYTSLIGTALATYLRKVQTSGAVHPFGGERPSWLQYPNGSRIYIGGMDNPDKILSAERDLIYVNQAEELTLDDWEKLTTRVTGRAGNMPWSQLLGDCNPGPPSHWIQTRARAGQLRLLESRHEDNPVLYQGGVLTAQGRRTMATLDGLTGVRKQRLRYGRWVQAEGGVYEEFDRAAHVVDRFTPPADWRRFRAVDFGFTAPFVCQWWALDGDLRMYLYREMYMTRRTVRVHAGTINALSAGEIIETTVCDHDAEDRATLEENGIMTTAAQKAISVGIQRVQERLKPADDGRARLFFLRDALHETDQALATLALPICTEQEIESYIWSNKATKEIPVKENDHGMDAMRYAVMYVEGPAATGLVSYL